MDYEVVIGLEVHAQLTTASKIFCGCSTAYGAAPNVHTCPMCLGLPGALPVLNKKAVDYALMLALATHCQIAPVSHFARKNYFYPDLPKGYQISQFEVPLARNGWIEIENNSRRKTIRLTRIHLEEDAGKSIHDETTGLSYLDFNRAGVPLIEIVTEPDISSADEAVSYLKKLRSLLRYLGISSGNMEEGSYRCDANVSLRPRQGHHYGTRTELKNLNSFKHVQRALEFELKRQLELLESGGSVVQETRLWNEHQEKTYPMRGKEESHDYRYFPEPDLPPLTVDQAWLSVLRHCLPELPDEKTKRFIEHYGLPEYDVSVLTTSRELADYFELCVREAADPKLVGNWIMSELLRELKGSDKGIEDCPVSPSALGELLRMIKSETISGKIGKSVFREMYLTGKSAEVIVQEKGLTQISDEHEIAALIDQVLRENRDQVTAFEKGKVQLFGFFVGQVLKKSKGRANPKMVNETLKRVLRNRGVLRPS